MIFDIVMFIGYKLRSPISCISQPRWLRNIAQQCANLWYDHNFNSTDLTAQYSQFLSVHGPKISIALERRVQIHISAAFCISATSRHHSHDHNSTQNSVTGSINITLENALKILQNIWNQSPRCQLTPPPPQAQPRHKILLLLQIVRFQICHNVHKWRNPTLVNDKSGGHWI